MTPLGGRIREARRNAGLSQEKLAEQIGVSRQAVTKWEAGQAAPSTENLLRLAEALHTPVETLLGTEPDSRQALAEQIYALQKAEARQGAEQVLSSCPDSVSVFILPPSGTELERRLRGRHTDSEEKIRSRLLAAKRECAEAGKYGYIVVNDSAQAAAEEINAIITAEKCKSAYRTNLVTEVLIS